MNLTAPCRSRQPHQAHDWIGRHQVIYLCPGISRSPLLAAMQRDAAKRLRALA